VSSGGSVPRAQQARQRRIRVWQRYAEHVVAPDDGQPKLTGSLLSPFLRSETPLSTEVSSIIAAGDRMIPSCSAAAESGHAADDATTSPHRSQSVPVGLLFDLDDISAEFTNDPCFDVFDGKSEPSYSDLDDFNLQLRRPSVRRAAAPENRAGFWETLPRGDHLISGASFCPEQCAIGDTSSPMIARVTAGCRGVVASTPPHSQNPSPSFVDAGYHQLSRPPTVCAAVIGIDTPTSLEQVPAANDNLVDELFSNNAQLTGTSAVGYEWEDDVVSVGRLIAD
jgi:hypothetical protein